MTEENTAAETVTKEDIKAQAAAVKASGANEAELVEQGDKVLSMIGYFSFLCLLPLLLRPDSKFCQFHGKQGLAITIIFLILGMFLGWVFAVLFGYYGMYQLLGLFQFLLGAWGVMMAFNGKMTKMPGVSVLAEKFDW